MCLDLCESVTLASFMLASRTCPPVITSLLHFHARLAMAGSLGHVLEFEIVNRNASQENMEMSLSGSTFAVGFG